jgi:hypothetical protein
LTTRQRPSAPSSPAPTAGPLAAAGIVDQPSAEVAGDQASGSIVRDHAHLADRERDLDHVPEHRECDLAAHVLGQAALPPARNGTTVSTT